MADYTPVAMPGTAYTLVASGPITGGDLLGMTGPLTVARLSTAAALTYVGVAGHDQVTGQRVTVHIAKAIHDSIAEGTVTAGDQVVSSSVAGRQVKTLAVSAQDVSGTPTQTSINTAINTAVNQARALIGIAVTTAADNQTVRWVQD